ncbi:hypothetical protein B0T10DRAFT_539238 [Thelonectria olida]|uniref:C2H2-type domain-containing protein n=1 Tax=Thelonectria olida TaxID=1576542 RepID=A0A9P9AKF8_9HYPO|nr:hypothetical protein B0T10DRAFT_539238 [Thelonectria olida]
MAEHQRSYSCLACPATFARVAHLRRHERTHATERQFSCPFCQTAFPRSDSARRHSKTCSRRNGQPVPTPLKRGRKFQACDYCALAKSACPGGQPCSTCLHRKHACTYSRTSRTQAQPGSHGVGEMSLMVLLPPNLHVSVPFSSFNPYGIHMSISSNDSVPWTRLKMKFSFLLHYTDPQNNFLQEYFHPFSIGTDNATNSRIEHTEVGESEMDPHEVDVIRELDDWFSIEFEEINGWECTSQLRIESPHQSHFRNSHSSMELRMTDILSALKSKSRDENSTTGSIALSKSAEALFAADKVDSLVQSYFENWHRHCPVLHQPSFDPLTSFTPLLTAVMLVGAIYSSNENAEAARNCLDAAESYIFGHDAFRRLLSSSSRKAFTSYIEPLQAGFIISIPQHWDTHRNSRHRVRLHRYADLISAARQLGLPKLRHDTGWRDLYNAADHDAFIKTEQGIRLMMWIFLVDSTPPRLTLSELTGSLPCLEGLFSTNSMGPEHEHLWLQSVSKIPSTAQGMSMLMGDEWTDATLAGFGKLDHLDLFILVSGLHEIIFNGNVACAISVTKPALHRALSRWRFLWDLNINQSSSFNAPSIGFFQHADEYWSLANLLLEESVPSIRDRTSELDQDSMDEVNNLIKRFACAGV